MRGKEGHGRVCRRGSEAAAESCDGCCSSAVRRPWRRIASQRRRVPTATLRRRKGPCPLASARSGGIAALDWSDADRKGWLAQVVLVFLAADLHKPRLQKGPHAISRRPQQMNVHCALGTKDNPPRRPLGPTFWLLTPAVLPLFVPKFAFQFSLIADPCGLNSYIRSLAHSLTASSPPPPCRALACRWHVGACALYGA